MPQSQRHQYIDALLGAVNPWKLITVQRPNRFPVISMRLDILASRTGQIVKWRAGAQTPVRRAILAHIEECQIAFTGT